MQKELARESDMLEARQDQIAEAYDLTKDARHKVDQAINQTMEMTGFDNKSPEKKRVTVSPVVDMDNEADEVVKVINDEDGADDEDDSMDQFQMMPSRHSRAAT